MLKLSADDIATQTFERKFRGYAPEQVEEFLQTVAREWEHLVSELERTRESLDERKEELKDFRDRERSLHETLEMAKRVAEEIKEKAQRDAELTVADAELEAERVLAEAEGRVAELRQQIHSLKQQRMRYEAELRSVIDSHQSMLDQMDVPEELDVSVRSPEGAKSDGPPAAPASDSSPELGDDRDDGQDTEPGEDETVEVGDEDIEQAEQADGPPIVTH